MGSSPPCSRDSLPPNIYLRTGLACQLCPRWVELDKGREGDSPSVAVGFRASPSYSREETEALAPFTHSLS